MKQKIHDISMTLKNDMLTYPKDVLFNRYRQRDMDKGDSSNTSAFETSAHNGTHVDAPLHFIKDRYATEAIPLRQLYGQANVVDCQGLTAVTAQFLKDNVPAGTERLLLKTDNSQLLKKQPEGPFNPNFVYLTKCGAEFCVDNGIITLAIDYLTVDKSGIPEKHAHNILLGNNILIIESVILAEIEPGEYFLACGSLKIEGSDGAPARAVLIENIT